MQRWIIYSSGHDHGFGESIENSFKPSGSTQCLKTLNVSFFEELDLELDNKPNV